MSRTYTPGPDADAIVDRLLAKGRYRSADEVVRACLELLQRHDTERDELIRRTGAGDLAAGRRYYSSGSVPAAGEMAAGESGTGKDTGP